MILKHAAVERKGGSSDRRKFEEVADAVTLGPGLQLSFTTLAQGGTGGTSGSHDFRVLIGAEDYPAILKAMCAVDREAGLLAAASVLVEHLTAIKEERDMERAREAEEAAKRMEELGNFLAQSR